ncbi:MAG: PKD domain-containing protein, partial [Cellulomonas sp.]
GDGGTASGVTAEHTFAAAGTYPVTLTVMDDGGATGTVTHQVTVTAPAPQNQAPVAAFTPTAAGLVLSVSGAASSDADGTVASYAWSFGDGGTASGVTAEHTFAAAGTYPVTLTVTDDGGATGTVTHQVTVTAPPNPPSEVVLASDTFARSLTTGWGTADIGGAWVNSGAASQYGVASGLGLLRINAAGWAPRVQLATVSAADVDVSARFSLDKLGDGGGTYVSLTGRTNGWNSLYRGKVWVKSTGAVNVSITRLQGTEVTLAQANVPGVALVPGEVLNARLQIVGASPTTLRFRVWKDGTAEPTTWQLTTTDLTAELQDAGGVGIDTTLSGSATNAPVNVQVAGFRVVQFVG